MTITKKKKTVTKTNPLTKWYNYGGYSRESDAKKDARFLISKKLTKHTKVVPRGSEDGTIYWIYTSPKVKSPIKTLLPY